MSPLPDFTAVQEALHTLASLGSAAESHGMLCALLSADTVIREEAWVDSLLNEHVEASDTSRQEACHILRDLFSATTLAFQENDFSMPLLLPDDDTPLFERIDALSEWCEGYITGLHLMGLAVQHNKNETLQLALNDLIDISQVELEKDDEIDPESEGRYVDLVEFVKVAVLTVATELKLIFDHAQVTPTKH